MDKLRQFFNTNGGKITAVALVLLALVIAFYSFRSNLGMSSASAISRDRMFIDATTGKPFEHVISVGETLPVKAPSGDHSGWPAELCYWTKDGKPKQDPTPVLLNQYVKKPGPTFCPDCGRMVRPHNPAPGPGVRPPPTKAEYEQQQANRRGSDQGDER
jgi:hypothetical protein